MLRLLILPLIFSFLPFALGIGGLLYVKRKSFYRRNMVGADTFPTFGKMLGTRSLEFVVRIVSFILIIIGIAVFFVVARLSLSSVQ